MRVSRRALVEADRKKRVLLFDLLAGQVVSPDLPALTLAVRVSSRALVQLYSLNFGLLGTKTTISYSLNFGLLGMKVIVRRALVKLLLAPVGLLGR